ncbi:MAG: hypothetical protein ACRCZF_02275, partial [Gemmataceae bacterium]
MRMGFVFTMVLSLCGLSHAASPETIAELRTPSINGLLPKMKYLIDTFGKDQPIENFPNLIQAFTTKEGLL